MRVAVVGGGIIGISSAVEIQDRFPNIDITIISEEFSPNTTADGAAGLWTPIYLGEDEDMLRITKWSKETFDFIKELWKSPLAGSLGIALTTVLTVSTMREKVPEWKDVVPSFRCLTDEELLSLRKNKPLKYGVEYPAFTCEVIYLIPYLLRNYQNKGGKVQKAKVSELRSLAGRYDFVINCTGLGAHHLVPDSLVHPIRGQVMRIKAPSMMTSVTYEEDDVHTYIIPNRDSVVVGGTHEHNNWDTRVSSQDSSRILENSISLFPKLQTAEKMQDWVGLRPGRCAVRLEHELLQADTPLHVIHNYGHGGSGITLFKGCANEVVSLLEHLLHHKSKL